MIPRILQFLSLVFALALVLWLLSLMIRMAKADDLAARVAEAMSLPPLAAVPPVVVTSDCNGRWGETDGKEIRICDRVPEACRERVRAHELAHAYTGRSFGAMPKEEGEAIARAVEAAIDPEYKPNCDSKE